MELVDSPLPSNLRYLFGLRNSATANNYNLLVDLDGANSKFRMESLWIDASNFTTANAVSGHRYRFTIRKRYNYNGERCELEDVTA